MCLIMCSPCLNFCAKMQTTSNSSLRITFLNVLTVNNKFYELYILANMVHNIKGTQA
jgi:hypothetical protein